MGVCRLSEAQKVDTRQHVEIYLDHKHLLLDAKTFPVVCGYCHKLQPELFVHLGSRYGLVGYGECCFCNKAITIIDHDNIVTEIQNDKWLPLQEWYLIDWGYIEQLTKKQQTDVIAALKDVDHQCIPLDDFRLRLQKALHMEEPPFHHYIADKTHALLPEDVNRWISFLDAVGVVLPDNIERVDK